MVNIIYKKELIFFILDIYYLINITINIQVCLMTRHGVKRSANIMELTSVMKTWVYFIYLLYIFLHTTMYMT